MFVKNDKNLNSLFILLLQYPKILPLFEQTETETHVWCF